MLQNFSQTYKIFKNVKNKNNDGECTIRDKTFWCGFFRKLFQDINFFNRFCNIKNTFFQQKTVIVK